MLARIHAVLRRFGEEEQMEKKLSFDRLVVNLDSYELLVDGKRACPPWWRTGGRTWFSR